jgi:hypothetical protein
MLPFWIIAASVSTGLVVTTPTVDALCPDLEQTRLAVAARVGELEVQPGKPWRASYTLVHSPSSGKPDVIRLELIDPDGNARLRRDLPLQGQSCRDMAEVIALVLDRYFRSLRQGAEPEPAAGQDDSRLRTDESQDPAAAGGATAPNAAPPTQPAPETRSAAAAPAAPQARLWTPADRTLWLGAGIGRSTPEKGLALELGAQAELLPHLEMGVHVLAAISPDSETVGPGEAHLQTRAVRTWVALGDASEHWTYWVGPALGLSADHAWTTGLDSNGSAWRPRLLFGLTAGAAAWLLPNWAMTLRAGVDVSPPSWTAELTVADHAVLQRGSIGAYAVLGVAYGIGR